MKYIGSNICYFSPQPENLSAFSSILREKIILREKTFPLEEERDIVLLCIGSDKISGDCLGPFVGSKLKKIGVPIPCYGTLAEPVHAVNLKEMLCKIKKKYQDPFFIVVDAAVGEAKQIGMVGIRYSPLFPGQGVGKEIAPVGHLSITGIVNEDTPYTDLILPYVSLHLVNTLATFIAEGIQETFQSSKKGRP